MAMEEFLVLVRDWIVLEMFSLALVWFLVAFVKPQILILLFYFDGCCCLGSKCQPSCIKKVVHHRDTNQRNNHAKVDNTKKKQRTWYEA